jgi:histidine triad (HIT) family protein
MDDCVFCKIGEKKIPAEIKYESDNIIAIADINPASEVHILIMPKAHVKTIRDAKGMGKLLQEVYSVVDDLVEQNKLHEDEYRVLVNGGKAQKVPHLHFHLLGGKWKKGVREDGVQGVKNI